MDHFASDASVVWYIFMWTRAQPVIEIYLIPDTLPDHAFSYPFQL